MLDPREKAAFDGLVTQLRSADPRFYRRMERLGTPKPHLYAAAAVALWTFAPLCIVFGGWTGTLIAAICCAYGFRLYAKRKGPEPQPAWWVATPRFRPSGPR